MELFTERLILRPWRDGDAADLYELARDERIGPAAGWPPHRSVGESLEVIRTHFSAPETYAVVLRDTMRIAGCVGLLGPDASNFPIGPADAEVGYWLGVPCWGRGLMPEAVREVARHAFEDLHLETLWCGWFEGNMQSERVQAKCGFRYVRTEADTVWPLTGIVRTQHISRLTRGAWLRAATSL